MAVSTVSRPKQVPARSADFGHLSLEGLRNYRRALSAEEGRVSYWRRIIQARLDVVRAATETGGPTTVESLRNVFADARVGAGRQALLTVLPVEDMPPLPDLAKLWDADPAPGDSAAAERLLRDLGKAEAQLSSYRAALHRRIAAATTELIARYHEDPAQCFTALPVFPRPRQAQRA